MGATPLALGIAGILFIFNTLTYAEGTAMLPEAGGSASFARHSFGDLAGFVGGWALMLSYVVTISLSAFTIPPYLGYFWEPLKESPIVGTAASMAIILFLLVVNVLGVRETSFVNVLATVVDVILQLTVVVLGFIVIFNYDVLVHNMTSYWPTWQNLILGIALAALAYTGVETMSQMAEETRRPEKKVPRALILMIVTVLLLFGGVSNVALSAMTPQELATSWATDPVAGIVHNISLAMRPQEMAAALSSEEAAIIVLTWIFTSIRDLLPAMVAVLAASILFIATNAGVMGISRLSFSLGRYQLIPHPMAKVHPRFKTPYVSIILFATIGFAILIPGFFAPGVFVELGALYVFGSLLGSIFAHASILGLRIKRPDLARPFRLRVHVNFKGRELPVTAILGLVGTLTIWVAVLVTQPYSRWVGLAWMALGLIVYIIFRWRKRLPLGGMAGQASPLQRPE